MRLDTDADATAEWDWISVERGLWVARCDEEFAGMIEQEFGVGFSSTDGTGHALGLSPTLGAAQSALQAAHDAPSDRFG